MSAHWGVPDPAREDRSEAERWAAFQEAFHELESRIRIFTSLPLASLDRMRLQQHLDEIGRSSRKSAEATATA